MNLLRLITARKGAAGLDPDAQAFITAAGITNPTQQSAITQLVNDLQAYGLWSKMKAVYPIVGGTASSHSYNLINPALYQITWIGAAIHNSSGVTGLGGYGETGLIPSSVLSQNSSHISSYATNVTSAAAVDLGTISASGLRTWFGRRYGGLTYFNVNQASNNSALDSNFSPYNGLATCTRTGSAGSDVQLYLNDVSKLTGTVASFGLSNVQYYVCAVNINNSPNSVSPYTYSWFSIGDGLNSTDVSNLYTAVQAFQTTLGRQV